MAESVSDIYGGNYLNSRDLINKGMAGTKFEIEKVIKETFEQRDGSVQIKLVLLLKDQPKALALNKTNATIMASAFSEDYTKWSGKPVSLKIVPRNFNGQMVDGIEVVPLGA